MTIAELIEQLQAYPPDTLVVVKVQDFGVDMEEPELERCHVRRPRTSPYGTPCYDSCSDDDPEAIPAVSLG